MRSLPREVRTAIKNNSPITLTLLFNVEYDDVPDHLIREGAASPNPYIQFLCVAQKPSLFTDGFAAEVLYDMRDPWMINLAELPAAHTVVWGWVLKNIGLIDELTHPVYPKLPLPDYGYTPIPAKPDAAHINDRIASLAEQYHPIVISWLHYWISRGDVAGLSRRMFQLVVERFSEPNPNIFRFYSEDDIRFNHAVPQATKDAAKNYLLQRFIAESDDPRVEQLNANGFQGWPSDLKELIRMLS